jgi:aspartate aminotransferase
MNHLLSDRINNLATSQTLAMAALARELKAQGKDIISLSLGEPDFNTQTLSKKQLKKRSTKITAPILQ